MSYEYSFVAALYAAERCSECATYVEAVDAAFDASISASELGPFVSAIWRTDVAAE